MENPHGSIQRRTDETEIAETVATTLENPRTPMTNWDRTGLRLTSYSWLLQISQPFAYVR